MCVCVCVVVLVGIEIDFFMLLDQIEYEHINLDHASMSYSMHVCLLNVQLNNLGL